MRKPVTRTLVKLPDRLHRPTLARWYRHPYELGGLYWSCNLVLAHVESFIAIYLYTVSSDSTGKSTTPSFVWTSFATLEGLFIVFFAVFLLNIKRSYISTFFTTMTAKQFACDAYRRATTDEIRFDIFGHHSSYYASIREELRSWLSTNWTRWTVDEEPAWFTPRILASIPEDLLPKSATQETKELRRQSIETQRKKSIVEGLPIIT